MKNVLVTMVFLFFSVNALHSRTIANSTKSKNLIDESPNANNMAVTSLKITKLCGANAGFFPEEIQQEQMKTGLTFEQVANADYLDDVVNDEYYKANPGYKNSRCGIRVIKVEPALTDLSKCEWLNYSTYKPKNINIDAVCVGSIVCYKGIIEGVSVIPRGKDNYSTPAFCNTKGGKCPSPGECGSENESVSKYNSQNDYSSDKYQVEIKKVK
ncbi:MAG: hypothetical protein NTY22_09695 [Proteobacteria bacterium]|nr:hypothetical protein [Pseudomonadota bacterium]